MALDEISETTKNATEDDDFGCYFLQPTSSPYNITEKLQQANFDLFTSTPQSTRSVKVKFKDELISFEPDLTDDDVNSIESDHVAEEILNYDNKFEYIEEEETKLLQHNVLRGGVGIYDIEEEVEDDIFEEEAVSEENEDDVQPIQNEAIAIEINETNPEKEEEAGGDEDKPSESLRENSDTVRISSIRQKSPKRKKYPVRKTEVHCKDHCIERIDTHLSISIKKLEIHEKTPVNLPPLQLHQRKCCDDNKLSISNKNLPHYNGCRSEYGLSSRQIKNRNRHMEMIRQKEMARQKLIDEYRSLKIQQNEEVFCQWLKEVSRRQQKEQQLTRNLLKHGYKTPSPGSYQHQQQKCLSPNVVNINKTVNKTEKIKERPNTAVFVPKTNIKKKRRPHTTQSACVYIEIPPEILKRGVHLGDLLITNSKEVSKKLHILTVS